MPQYTGKLRCIFFRPRNSQTLIYV
jgi:hypothetical protein